MAPNKSERQLTLRFLARTGKEKFYIWACLLYVQGNLHGADARDDQTAGAINTSTSRVFNHAIGIARPNKFKYRGKGKEAGLVLYACGVIYMKTESEVQAGI